MKKTVITLLVALFISSFSYSATNFTPGKSWNDTGGAHINAHGGCVVYHEGVYYWFGEDRTGSKSNGISCYSSSDLYNWKRVGLALTTTGTMGDKATGNDIAPGRTLERPKVIYNASTNKWVMWVHWENGSDYGQARVCVASSDKVSGPYVFHNTFRPNERDSRDQTLFLDTDGKAYHFCSTNMNSNMNIAQLQDDFLNTSPNEVLTLLGKKYEAPAIIKLTDMYFGVFSGCTGWDPNPGRYAYSYDMLSQWTYGTKDKHSDGSVGTNFAVDDYGTTYLANTTYKSQSAYVFRVEGKENAFVYMGDRWNSGNVGGSEYVWLPLSMRSGYPAVRWYDSWDLSVFDEMYRFRRAKEIVSGNTYSFLDKYSNRLVANTAKGLAIENDDKALSMKLIATETPYVYKIQNADGKFWSVVAGSSIRMMADEDEEYGQEWYFEYEEDGYYKIKNLACGDYLSVSSSSTYAGNPVYLTSLGKQFSQSFAVYFDSKTNTDYEDVDIFSNAYRADIAERMAEQKRIVGVSEIYASEETFDLYPTLGNGVFTVETVTEYQGAAEMVVSDMKSGCVLYTENVNFAGAALSFDLSDKLISGTYLVQFITAEGTVTKKLIVE